MIEIGNKKFKYKKEALAYYKSIMNSYKFNQSLNDEYYNDLLDLIDYNNSFVSEEESLVNIRLQRRGNA